MPAWSGAGWSRGGASLLRRRRLAGGCESCACQPCCSTRQYCFTMQHGQEAQETQQSAWAASAAPKTKPGHLPRSAASAGRRAALARPGEGPAGQWGCGSVSHVGLERDVRTMIRRAHRRRRGMSAWRRHGPHHAHEPALCANTRKPSRRTCKAAARGNVARSSSVKGSERGAVRTQNNASV